MLGLPKSTEFNRRIPKQKFYENLTISSALKRIFVEQIRVIWWRNKIAPATMNLAAGEAVTEIEVFEVCLSAPQLDEAVLRQIDKEIPYHILFLLEYEGKYQACLSTSISTFPNRNSTTLRPTSLTERWNLCAKLCRTQGLITVI